MEFLQLLGPFDYLLFVVLCAIFIASMVQGRSHHRH